MRPATTLRYRSRRQVLLYGWRPTGTGKLSAPSQASDAFVDTDTTRLYAADAYAPRMAPSARQARLLKLMEPSGGRGGPAPAMDAVQQDAKAPPVDELVAKHSLGHRVHVSFCTS